MRRIDRLFLILVLSLSAMQSTAVAWDNKKTHPDISERAALKSVIAGKDYLDRIGLSTTAAIPLEEVVAGKKILAWIRDGAEYEDAGTIPDALAHTARYLNHFHNPLRTNAQWPTAGLDDSTLNYHVWGMSLIEWAQSPTVQSSYLEGDHSWKAARDNYFLALTSPLDNTRREYFAKVFRDLGFQMHLVQDASVPDHVRNDNHGLESISGYSFKGGTFIEGRAANHPEIVNPAASSPIKPSVSFDVSYGGRAPITQLVDTDSYTGSNPSASTSLSWGLAEYANANFFSDDTMFAADDLPQGDPHYFPYPKKLSTNYQAFLDKWIDPQTSIARDGFIEACPYIEKKDDGEVVSHLLRPSYHTQDVQGLSVVIFDRTFYRDDECKDEYIRHLVPRAAGYSTALIDFFFRAKMDLFPSYSINSGHVIKNNTDESMVGEFHLYYDNTSGSRVEIKSGNFPVASTVIDANGKSGDLTFSEPTDAKNPGEYMLVFRGVFGKEAQSVAGAVVRPPRLLLTIEPNSLVIGNVHDKVVAYNVVLDANIVCLDGQAKKWLDLFYIYASLGQGVQMANAWGAYEAYAWARDELINEKMHWVQFHSAVMNAAEARTRFTGGSEQTDFSGMLSDLTAHYYSAYLNPSLTPTWSTMPAEAKTHTFMTGPSFNGSSMLFLMFWTKAGTVRDSEKATILSKSFYFNAAFLIEPRLTVTIDGTPWIEGLQGWWSGETSNTYTMDVPHHAKVRMSTSVLDASNYCGSRDHTLTMDLELFSFDFRIKKE